MTYGYYCKCDGGKLLKPLPKYDRIICVRALNKSTRLNPYRIVVFTNCINPKIINIWKIWTVKFIGRQINSSWRCTFCHFGAVIFFPVCFDEKSNAMLMSTFIWVERTHSLCGLLNFFYVHSSSPFQDARYNHMRLFVLGINFFRLIPYYSMSKYFY